MQKKVLFILPSFGIGGTTVSTRNLISVLDKNKYDIVVWALCNYGILREMYADVPQLKTNFFAQALALDGWRKEINWQRRFAVALVRFLAHHSTRIKLLLYQYSIKKSVGNYAFDTIVACEEGFCTSFVSHMLCENRVAWVRCDYKRYYNYYNRHKEVFYKKYNHIVCVAEKARESFVEIYPDLKDRVVCIYNPQDSKLIMSQAEIDDHDERFCTDKKVIVSVGRLNEVKRFEEIPSIACALMDKGIKFVWYIIGDGEEKVNILSEIKRNKVDSQVILLGAKSNPHFYIKRADLYVCLSLSEACPRVINEAKILGTPVVSTDFPTVYEYLENGIDGYITSLDNIVNTIAELLSNEKKYNSIKRNISVFQFDNTSILNAINKII